MRTAARARVYVHMRRLQGDAQDVAALREAYAQRVYMAVQDGASLRPSLQLPERASWLVHHPDTGPPAVVATHGFSVVVCQHPDTKKYLAVDESKNRGWYAAQGLCRGWGRRGMRPRPNGRGTPPKGIPCRGRPLAGHGAWTPPLGPLQAGMRWKGGEPPPPPCLQGARPMPSHCPPDAKRQLQ